MAKYQLIAGALALEVDETMVPLVESSWLPRNAVAGAGETPAVIRLGRRRSGSNLPSSSPTLTLGSARLWISDAADAGTLTGTEGCSGTIDFTQLRADLATPEDPAGRAGIDLYPMLTISAAMLLGRLGRALIHAAAVIAPDGAARMLIGDARSGKSTTAANLIARGWNYLSDDQVILSRGASEELMVEGLLRPFHLDEGWGRNGPLRRRRAVDAGTLGAGRPVARAPLGALLFPRVSAGETTLLGPVSSADAMAGLIRQSPWLLADRVAAAGVMELLQLATRLPKFALRLGLDTFGNAELLEGILVSGER
ncbi:MAG: hypothetical protein HY700_21540 [Gemmatimonadetes bacterium]|nr:hypothetical protein [Gemmatimonadota bacterium]